MKFYFDVYYRTTISQVFADRVEVVIKADSVEEGVAKAEKLLIKFFDTSFSLRLKRVEEE